MEIKEFFNAIKKILYGIKLSIRVKFSIFIAIFLFCILVITGMILLNALLTYQSNQQNDFLIKQKEMAIVLIKKDYESNRILYPDSSIADFIDREGDLLAIQIEDLSKIPVLILDSNGNTIQKKKSVNTPTPRTDLLEAAKKGKTVYIIEGDIIHYVNRIQLTADNYLMLFMDYSIKTDNIFYEKIRKYLIYTYSLSFLIGFAGCFAYFDQFVRIIRRITGDVKEITKGNFDIISLKRNDELGELSCGIHEMSSQIHSNLVALANEKDKLNQFFSNITHEFKTPLTSINANADLLSLYRDDEEVMIESIESIKKESARLYEMITKVLLFSATGRQETVKKNEKMNLKEILTDIVSRIKGKAWKYGIEIKTNLEDAYVFADKESLFHIFLNLIDNAIKYNRQGGKVFIKVERSINRVRVLIVDTGLGISEEHQARIFEPFFTVSKDRNRVGSGTGLGLSIVKQMLSEINGGISIIRSDNNGTTFEISFESRVNN